MKQNEYFKDVRIKLTDGDLLEIKAKYHPDLSTGAHDVFEMKGITFLRIKKNRIVYIKGIKELPDKTKEPNIFRKKLLNFFWTLLDSRSNDINSKPEGEHQ